MTAAFWCPLPRDVVMVHGRDAQAYLHSQLSQEVRDLAVGEARWTFLLEPTGKVSVLARVLRSGDAAYVLDTDAGWGEALVARLQRFRIRVDADIEPIPWRCLAVRGATVPATPGSVAVPAWWGEGTDLLGPDPQPPPGVPAGTPEQLEAARVEAGWPAMGAEIGAATLPAETGLVRLAVSFTKGCYPGQELVERMDSRGASAPRQLRRLRLAEPAGHLAGAAVVLDGEEVGAVTSSTGPAALALVRRAVTAAGPVEVVGPDGRRHAATLLDG